MARPFAPMLHSTRGYSQNKFRRDLIAGLTVSVVELPQSMAYAMIAGVPPQYGIYSSIIQGVLGAMLSSSEHLTTGPTNTQALLIASAAMPLVDRHGAPEAYLQIVFLLTFLKGLIQLGMWGLRAGDLVQYISRSVLVGVSAGAGVLIIVNQSVAFLGLQGVANASLPGVLGQLQCVWRDANHANWRAIAIAAGVIAVSQGARQINKLIPGPLIGVLGAAVAVALLGWGNSVPTIGHLPKSLPHMAVPGQHVGLETVYLLLPGALALALLGGIESVAIAKTIAAKSGERIVANQELFAQGFKNAVTSFIQCIPGSASFTRSMLDYEAGAQTRWAAVMNAVFVGILFYALSGAARFIPMAALAGVLIVIAVRLIDFSFFCRIAKADRSDAAVLVITFLAVLMARLEYAIFVGIFANIAFFLRSSARLHVSELEEASAGKFVERDLYDRSGERRIAFLQVEGELFFAVADQLQDRLTDARGPGARAIVLRLKRCHYIDGTVLDVLERFAINSREQGGYLVLCGLRPPVLRTMQKYGLDAAIGRENLFAAQPGSFVGARRALDRAKSLIGYSIDTSVVEAIGELDYDI